MKSKIQSNNQLKLDWALQMCERDKLKMNLNTLTTNERDITFATEQKKLKNKKTQFDTTKSIIEYLKYQSSIVTFYVPKLDMLEISYAIQDESTMVLQAKDKKSEVYCLFTVTKENSKYRLEFVKVDYRLTNLVEKTLKYA